MGLNEALDIFNISDITQETEESIKKKYKKLMVKYHPDSKDGDESKAKNLSIALKVLKEAISNMSKFKDLNKTTTRVTVVIPIHKLIDIYNGETITMGTTDDRHIIGKKEIQRYNTLIISDVGITHNGLMERFTNIQPWTIHDNYEVNCDVYVDNINNEESVRVHIEDYDKEIKFQSQSVVIRVTLKYNISISIRITKKTIDHSRD